MQSPDGSELWCPGQSLWIQITDHVPKTELPKIHQALGPSLVDKYKGVHNEAEELFKRWQESQLGHLDRRAGTPLPHQQGSPLPDPPVVKELLRGEVKMLLQTLTERASRGGRDVQELFCHYKPESVNYALGHLDSCQQNSVDPADCGYGSRPSTSCSVRSCAKEEIDSMRDKLNLTDIDQVVNQLRSVLNEECAELKRLVKHLQKILILKRPGQSEKSEPTLAELRELRGAIQMDLELYPPSLAAAALRSSPLPSKDLKSRSRLSAGQNVSGETLQELRTKPDLKPHPPPPLCQTKPKPPPGAPPSKTSASVKPIQSPSLSRTQRRNTCKSASPELWKVQPPFSSKSSASGHSDCSTSAPGPAKDQRKDETRCGSSVSLEDHRTTASSLFSRSAHKDTHHSPPQCDACNPSNNVTDYVASTAEDNKTQNDRRGGIESTTVQTDQMFSAAGGMRSSPSQTERGESNDRINSKKNGDLTTDTVQMRSKQLFENYCSTPRRSPGGAASHRKIVQKPKLEVQLVSQLKQPVSPPRMTT